MRKKLFIGLGVLFLISLSLFIFNLVYENALPKIIEEINNSSIGAIMTAIVTVFLLSQQTTSEEVKERNVKVFEKKQEVYHTFLEELKKIIQDGEITIVSKGKDANLDKSIDELKDLIFQLGYLQMHTSEKTINIVLDRVAKIIQLMNDFNSTQEGDKQKKLPEYYSSLSDELFKIIATLKQDLYNDECKPISKDKMNSILKECDLFVETETFDKYEIQKYFWTALQKKLAEKGYPIVNKDFTHDIIEYYARARNRHRYYQIIFSIYSSDERNIDFKIEIENRYYFGIKREGYKKNDELLQECVDATGSFASNDWWYGWRHPSEKFDLDFWNLNSKGFDEIKDTRKRDAFINGLVDEMDMYIKKFIVVAKEKSL